MQIGKFDSFGPTHRKPVAQSEPHIPVGYLVHTLGPFDEPLIANSPHEVDTEAHEQQDEEDGETAHACGLLRGHAGQGVLGRQHHETVVFQRRDVANVAKFRRGLRIKS